MATVVALGGESVSELRFKSVKLAIGSFVPADDVPTGVDAPGTGKLRAGETEAGIFCTDGEKAWNPPLASKYVPTNWPCILIALTCVRVAPGTGTSKLEHRPSEQTKPCCIEVMPASHPPTKSPRSLRP